MTGAVVHFELPTDNTERARKFYKTTFGWNVMPMEGFDYAMLGTSPSNEQGVPTETGRINGGMGPRGGPLSHPVITIHVENITATETVIAQNGGKVVQKRQPIGDGTMGFTGYFTDSEGNVVGLYERGKA